MAAYNLLSIPRVIKLALKAGFLATLITISYKIMRWLSPFLFVLAFSSVLCLFNVNVIYGYAAVLFVCAVILALIGGICDIIGIRAGLATVVYHFTIMNVAVLLGVVRVIQGTKRYWTPRG